MKTNKASQRPGTALFQKGQDRVEEILAAASQIVVEEGWAGFSVNKVAARAGMRIANVQYYFPTRNDLLHVLLNRIFDTYKTTMLQKVGDKELSPAAYLSVMMETIMESNKNPADCALVWNCWAMAIYDPGINKILDEWYIEYRSFFFDLIMRTSPRMAKAKAHRLAAVCVALLEGTSLLIGAKKNRYAELKGFEQEVERTIAAIAKGALG